MILFLLRIILLLYDSHNNHGNVIEQLLLENSEHTKHILSNELKYKETILNFINKNCDYQSLQ